MKKKNLKKLGDYAKTQGNKYRKKLPRWKLKQENPVP